MKISKLLKKSSKKKSLPPSTTNNNSQRKKKSQDPVPPPPSSPPTKKNVTFVNNANGGPVEDDEISAMTRGTDMPESPDRSSSYGKTYNYNNNAPPQPLLSSGFSNDDDSSSQDLLVFEDKTDDSLGSLPAIATSKVVASGMSGSEKSPLRVRFSEDSITMSAAAGTTSRQLFDNSNTKKSSKQNQQQQSSTKLRSSAISKLVKKKASYLTNTEYFRNTVNSAFDKIDVDKSGDVTLEELYAGLLLIHLKMAIYVGAPACRPASKKYVAEVFHKLDTDNSGTLDREEFATVMTILYSQVFTRIVIQWTLTLMIVPVTTKYILNYATLFLFAVHNFWKDIVDDLDPLQRLLWKVWEIFLYYSPEKLDQVGLIAWMIISKIPWKSMPPIILTVGQVSVALPYVLNHVEDFFRRAAHSIVSGDDDKKD